ncbi:MAG: RsmB/NOP family class I SAM-dependent RNA methyltransferase [Clostridia bacterium]|nr:RsmB/NOP family class I SAM-dependent RNA methyltransferase [Clostridia bacterium]
MADLPEAFLERMKIQLGPSYEAFKAGYEKPAEKGVRVNSLKISKEDFERLAPFELDGEVEWERCGYYVKGHAIGKTLLHQAGAFYVQEPSAMSAVPELEIEPGDKVLDMCAAPGGKSTQIAQYLKGEGYLVSNEINRKRTLALCENIERMGLTNAIVTTAEPEDLSFYFDSFFDKILVDAPCSGEGMFRKDRDVIYTWSEGIVKKCAARQKEILAEAAKMLAAGGRLVYSTCTFSEDEDENQISGFLESHPDFRLVRMKKLYPHEIRGEGHFVSVLEKTDGSKKSSSQMKPDSERSAAVRLYREWEKDTLLEPIQNVYSGASGKVHTFPDGAPKVAVCGNTTIDVRRNNLLGDIMDGRRFEPSHTLAMRLKPSEVRHISVDEETAIRYLKGFPIDCPGAESGWSVVMYEGMPLGWCKAVSGTAKNHLPKGLRMQM